LFQIGISPAFGSASTLITAQAIFNPKATIISEPLESVVVSARQFREYENIARDIARKKKPSSTLHKLVNNSKNSTKMFGSNQREPFSMIESINENYNRISEELLSSLNAKNQSNSERTSSFKEKLNRNQNPSTH